MKSSKGNIIYLSIHSREMSCRIAYLLVIPLLIWPAALASQEMEAMSLEQVLQDQVMGAFTDILPLAEPGDAVTIGWLADESTVLTTGDEKAGDEKATSAFHCLPTCSPSDGRFLVMASGTAVNSLSKREIELRIAVPGGTSSFIVGIFDGDGTELSATGESRWDNGFPTPFEYTLIADPLADGSGSTVVSLGGAPSAFSQTLPNNAWADFTVATGTEAQAPSGHYFYRLRIENLDPSIIALNAFKVRTTGLLTIEDKLLSYIANFASISDGLVIYPMLPNPTPTTFDGSFSFFFEVPADQSELTVWDGDFDHGKFDGSDQDTDDPNTPGAPFLPPWAEIDAVPEGVAMGQLGTTGAPRDDADPSAFGGLGVLQLRPPSIRYDLILPDGQVFANDNPTGNQEWEQFKISTAPFDPTQADFEVSSIPRGIYELRAEGVDMQNLNAFYIPFRILCVDELGGPCTLMPRPFLVGDTVYLDLDGNGVQDVGEPGISAVDMVLLSAGGQVLETTTTDAHGNYFFTLDPGTYGVQVAATNLDPGGTLEGLASTTGDERTVTVIDMNHLDLDFGYIGNGSIGGFVWHDTDFDGVQDRSEPGLAGVTLLLEADFDGDGVSDLSRSTVTDADGLYRFPDLSAATYTVSVVTSTLPSALAAQTFDLDGVFDSLATVELGPGEDRADVDFSYADPCGLTVEKHCQVTTDPAPFTCGDAKPLDVVGMTWTAAETIRVKAWKGDVGGTLLADIDGVVTGQEVTVSGFAGSPNDVYWEVFLAGSETKIGESRFHMSCSDDEMNGPEDCGQRQGDGKGTNTDFINDWSLDQLSGDGATLDCTPTPPAPAESCEVVAMPRPGCKTLDKPTSLVFSYSGGTCADSLNDQGSKTSCVEAGLLSGLTTLTSPNTKLVITPTVVGPGDEFTVTGDFGSSTVLQLSAGGVTQELDIHTSCSVPLAVHDVFGALTLTAFSDQRGGARVTYLYEVSNSGLALEGVTLVDNVLGSVAGPIDLATGESRTFTVDAMVTDTVTHVVDATGTFSGGTVSGTDTTCQANDSVTVTVTEPCAVCDGGTTDLVFAYLGAVAAHVAIYDSSSLDTDKVLFEGLVRSGGEIAITHRVGEDKLKSDVSLYVDGIFHAKVHTSCSKSIGPGQRIGDFQIVEGRSVDGGLMCPIHLCEMAAGGLARHDQELLWTVTNHADLDAAIERVTIQWPVENGDLIEVKRDGSAYHKGVFAPVSAVLESGWDGGVSHRTIKSGDSDTLKFKFDNDVSLVSDTLVTVEFDQGCSISGHLLAPASGGDFACTKPIDALTMIWDGSPVDIMVTAWKGSVGEEMLADMVPVSRGEELTVSGYAGSSNDVFWEIFEASTGAKIGESNFHLSCSDDDMDGPEDCGQRQGDGKGSSEYLNDWILEGMVDSLSALDCTEGTRPDPDSDVEN